MNKLYSAITDFIFMEDKLELSEVILVPGGSHIELVEKAVELYHMGLAKYILPSGGKNNKIEAYESEWQFFADNAIELGVPKEVILKENKASNTFENAIFSKKTLIENNISTNKLILVCKNFHARRAYLTYKSQFPVESKIFVAPVVDGKKIEKETWFIEEINRRKVLSEVEKIGIYFSQWIK